MAAEISIIIVNYNVRHFIKRTLESVYASNLKGLSIKVYVVDNASIDGSVDMIASSFPNVELISNAANVGFSIANNQAIRKSNSPYVLILNPDTVLQEDTLQKCFEYMEVHPEVGALGVKMIDGAGNFLPESKRELPGLWNSFAKLSGLSSMFPKSKLFNSYALGHLDENKRHKIEVLCGAFMFVRQEAIDRVGMFDERFFMYGEDIDWSRRIGEGGYEIHYIPDTTIIHFKGESTKKASLNYVKTFYGAMGLYVEKHYEGNAGKWFSRILKVAIAVRAGLSGLRRILAASLVPVIDLILLVFGMLSFAHLWARYYFQDVAYYNLSPLRWNVLMYAAVWIFSLWFVGYYQKSSWQKRIIGVGSGLVLILIGYALLHDGYRSSRVITIVGGAIGLLVTAMTGWIFRRSPEQIKAKKILIVAEKDVALQVEKALESAQVKSNILGVVNPNVDSEKSLDYLNDISELKSLSKVLKADEIIFSSENMTMKEIMNQMIQLDSHLSYKIAGDNSLSILGSNSKNTSGELYSFEIKYHLDNGYYRHMKRVFDMCLSVLMLVAFPILLVVNRFQLVGYFRNAFQLLFGLKTAVGYGGDKARYQNLPEIATGIIPLYIENKGMENENMFYARDYSLWKDLEVLGANLSQLHR